MGIKWKVWSFIPPLFFLTSSNTQPLQKIHLYLRRLLENEAKGYHIRLGGQKVRHGFRSQGPLIHIIIERIPSVGLLLVAHRFASKFQHSLASLLFLFFFISQSLPLRKPSSPHTVIVTELPNWFHSILSPVQPLLYSSIIIIIGLFREILIYADSEALVPVTNSFTN